MANSHLRNMKKYTSKCRDCNQPMFEVGGIGKIEQLGGMETMIVNGAEHRQWVQCGSREVKLYQCPKCKEVKIY